MGGRVDGLDAIDLERSSARTVHVAVIDELRRAMLSGVLPPGTRLVQADLARSLDVSVTPVREAIRDLVAEGLVEFDAYRGATVHTPSLAELEEIYEIRFLLTPPAVREAIARITDAEISEAEDIAARMVAAGDHAEWVDLNRQFHHVLTAASRRTHLQDVIDRMSNLSTLYVAVSLDAATGTRRRGDRDHSALIRAYRRRDVDRAVAISLKHIEQTLDDARRAIVAAGGRRLDAR
ncbi:GntR family transcriptional regulator [Mycolicibacterium sp. 050158]|uniref:GntR family transcriptional regulator n=1 Tax=Mycolicibacterium sp. 050158 TaxID=3090602 RepID=UPI00299EDB2B|nr:GntR family transcriptional regulator [Mycolicibacterium sp. 050158]MDX1888109.1 GntR family transcriptional regulator [Mycolicibacterium sp. 050158]